MLKSLIQFPYAKVVEILKMKFYKSISSILLCLFLIACKTPPERKLINQEFNSGIFRITYREPGAPFSDHHMILSYTDSLGKTVFEEETELFNDGKNLTNNNVKIQRVNGSIEFVLIGEEQKPEHWGLHPLSGFEKQTKPFVRHWKNRETNTSAKGKRNQ